MDFTQIFTQIQDFLPHLFAFVTALVTFASIIANKTKTDKDNVAVGYISNIVNFLALNFTKIAKK